MLANSTPASPSTITSAVGEISQDIRFAFLSSRLAINFPNWFAAIFASTPSISQTTTPSRIQIFPGSITVKQGEQVSFSAIGYDAQDEPLSGIDFSWRFADTGRGLAARPLPDGKFEAHVIGTFTVTVEGGSQQSQSTITVTPSAAGSSTQTNLQAITPISISSQGNGKETEKVEKTGTSDKKNSQESGQNLLPDEGVWNSGNWSSSDDPGNLPGNPPGHPADDGAGNGNFQLSAPVISLPGRGIDLALNLNYNSRLWNKSGSQLTYDIDRGFPAPGWSLGFGKIMDMGANGGSMLIDADGTRHGYAGGIFPGYYGASSFRGKTVDGKFIDYNSSRDSNGIYVAQAYFPNGTVITYGAKGDGAVYPTSIQDAQGNYITITYRNNIGPNIQTITDTLGRAITFDYDSLGRLISVKAPRMQDEDPIYSGGKTRTLFKIHYKPLTLNYSFASGITPMVRNSTPWVIDAIYYPATQTGYWFGDTDSYSSYGMITKVIEQRGMNWSASSEAQGTVTAGQITKQAVYNYPLTTANETGRTNGTSLSDAPTYTTLTEGWDGMDVAEPAVTTYAINNNDYHSDGTSNSPSRTITVTQPNGTISKQYSYRTPNAWTDGLLFADETIVMNGTTPTVISSSLVSWQQGDYDSPRPSWAEITDENGKKVKTVYDYSNGLFNQVTRSCDYDDGATKLRCATAIYENSQDYKGTWFSVNSGSGVEWYYFGGRHIFNLVTTTAIENPDGTIASRTDYEYDNYQNPPFATATGVIQHLSAYDPYTTDTVPVQGECIRWETPMGEPSYCVNWEYYDVSAYDPNTDKRGNLTKTTAYSDAQTLTGAIAETKSYDVTGNLRTASTACCEQMSVQYSLTTQFAYPESQTRGSADPNSPDRMTTYSVYDVKSGVMKHQTDANGRTSTMMYNPDTLRPVKSISSTGAYTITSYDDTAMTITEEIHESNGNLSGKNIKYLSGIGKVKREESLGTNNVWDIVEMKYTKYAEQWKQSRPFRQGETPVWSENIYDSQGRTTQIIETDGSVSKAFYNETQRPDSASNAVGNTIKVVDAWGRERWGRYDQQGRLAEVVEPNPNGNGAVMSAGSLKTSYKYDTSGRLIETEQGDQHRYFKYDSLGRLTRQKLSEQTATIDDNGVYVGAGNANAKWSDAFFYDNRSNLVLKTDARNVKSYYSYTKTDGNEDPLNRLQRIIYDITGTTNVLPAPSVSYQYMASGDKSRIQQIRTDGFLTENYSYDVEGRISEFTQTVDARTSYPMTTSYLYDSLDRATDVRYPAQYGIAGSPRKLVQPTYDTASRLTTLTVDGQQQAGDIVYNASDQTESIKIGQAGANQVTENYQYDNLSGLLTNQKVQKSGQTLLDLNYDYNRNNSTGNLNGKTGHLTKIVNNLDNNKNREYEFDALGRLTKAKGGNNLWQQNYQYDRYGNRTNVTASGVAADNSPIPRDGIPNLTYNTQTNRITTASFEYDSAGNQTRAIAEDGVTWLKYEYDAANRLQIIKKDDGTYLQAYQFGSTNQRLMDYDYITGQQKIFGNGGAIEYTEFASTIMTWTKSYVYLGDSILSTITPNGSGGETTEYNHPDRLGTRTITNQATGTSYEQANLPFGTALNAESTGSQSKRFTSYERSARTGLDYAVNRTYDSKQGRFTQVDPIGMGASRLASPQTLNLYTYCGNDPINHVDPDGLFFGSLFKWIGKIFKAINKILKWVVIAVVIATVAIAIFHSGGAAIGFLKAIMGIVGKLMGLQVSTSASIITNFAGEIVGTTLISSISIGLSGQIIAGLYGVGAVASQFIGNGKPKKRPGKYQTVEQAAIAILREYNPVSILQDREWAGSICERKNGEIFTTPPKIGSVGGSNVGDCPPGTQRVGTYHTHGANNPAYPDSESFSDADKINANDRSIQAGNVVPNYLATPSGTIKKFIPAVISGSTRGKVITLKATTSTVFVP